MNITDEINLFREVTRHLWNSYLRQNADWDTVEMYHEICRMIFNEKIVIQKNIDALPIPFYVTEEYLQCYKIISKGSGKLPLYVNRDIPPTGYWDYPVEWIPAEQDHDIRPICFFDFDVLGWRMLEYYRVRILKCPSHPEITGRDALISCQYVDLEI